MDLKLKDLPKRAVAQLKSGIRRSFRYTIGRDYLYAAREEFPRYTKSGKVSVIPDVYYRCAICGELFKQKEVQVDHIDPVVPLDKPELEMTVGEYAYRTFMNECQVACKTCHKEKSAWENKKRRERG